MKLKKIISLLLVLLMFVCSFPVTPLQTAQAGNKVYKGLDISHWNGTIDWSKMKSKGVDFIIIRCFSVDKDIRFDVNYQGATAAGIDVGAYVYMYATTVKEAKEEARSAVEALDGKGLDYPLFLDVEDKCLWRLKRSTLTDLVITELEIFRDAGYLPAIYCSRSFPYDFLEPSRLTQYPFWIAKWVYRANKSKKYSFSNVDPYNKERPECAMWQFSDGGYGPDYGCQSRYLDLNYCYVDFKSMKPAKPNRDPENYHVPTRTLKYNSSSVMTGEDVLWVQSVLWQLGYDIIVDGFYGPDTKTAIKDFQKQSGMTQTGAVDANTVKRLSDVYAHKDFSAKVRYNPQNSDSVISAGTRKFGESFTVGDGMTIKKDGYNLLGWALYRSSDKKYYCTDSDWHTSAEIKTGAYFKKLFLSGDKFSVSENHLTSDSATSETYTFYALWSTQKAPVRTAYYGEMIYYLFESGYTYSQAQDFCKKYGGELAIPDTTKKLSALKFLTDDKQYFVGAQKIDGVYYWNSSAAVTSPVSATGTKTNPYLTVSSQSISKPYTVFAVNSNKDVSGFIMELPCTHDNTTIKKFADTLCTVNGYSGDIVCTDCGFTVQKGFEFVCPGHTLGTYSTVKEPTCGEKGTKEALCAVCGETVTKSIAKTGKHVYDTVKVTAATTKADGQAYDVCTACGYKTKEYTVKKVGKMTLAASSAAYTGEKIKPGVTVTDSEGKVLSATTDYAVSYKNNKDIGVATATVKLTGKYSGSLSKTFKIVPAATAFTSASTKNGSVILDWNKASSPATGYIIDYTTDSTFKKDVKSVTVKNPDTTHKVIKNLKKGTAYYFKIKVYTSVDGVTYNSARSKYKKVTVK